MKRPEPAVSDAWARQFSRAVEGAPRPVRSTLERLCARHGASRVGAAIESVSIGRGNAEFQGTAAVDDEKTVAALERVDDAITAALEGDRAARRAGVFLPTDLRRLLAETRARVRRDARLVGVRLRHMRGARARGGAPRLEAPGVPECGIPPANNRAGLDAIFRGLGATKLEAERLVSYLLTLTD
jgi:hypothetical protein